MSGIINKIKEGIHDATRPKDNTATGAGVPEGTHGPHSTRTANAADPRVDSDLDNRAHHSHNTTLGSGATGTSATTGTTHTGSTNAGPHNSNLLNKLDPRVDSDMDGGRNAGMNQTTGPTGRTAGSAGYSGSTNAGPHDSNMANKLDPRVDSDLDGGRHMGMNQTTTYGGQPTGTTTTTGGTGAGFGTTGTTGTTHHTGSTNAGPHNSNLLNKLDPRVDSDLDGGRNAGMNQTTRTNY